MLVSSIDPLAPYKVSDDLMLDLVSVTAIVRNDPEGAAAGTCRVEIIEPLNLAKHQPPLRVHTRQSPGPNDLRQERRSPSS
jgi:hypothetical protein